MKRKLIIGSISLLVLTGLVTFLTWNPLRRPDIWLEHWIEKSTPFGSGYADVETTVVQRGWFGYPGQNASDGYWRFPHTYIRGELGEYQGLPFRTSVTAFWEFNESNRLTNIRIWRTRDAP